MLTTTKNTLEKHKTKKMKGNAKTRTYIHTFTYFICQRRNEKAIYTVLTDKKRNKGD